MPRTLNGRTLTSYLRAVVPSCLLLILPACDRGDPLRPPALHFGQDVCDVCHMIISDERYAAGMVVLDDRGRHQRMGFDDIGCIFEYEVQHGAERILARYVRDYQTREWLDAEAAEYVHSRDLHSPMAFGLAAVGSLDEARAVHDEYGGDLITLDEARRRFAQGVLHVSALDGEPVNFALESEKVIGLDDGSELRLALRTPQILPPGTHEFAVIVERRGDRGAWAPAGDLTLRIEPEMPSMGHGSPGNEDPQPAGEGEYRGTVNFTMAGQWLVHATVHAGGRELGRAAFAFEVTR